MSEPREAPATQHYYVISDSNDEGEVGAIAIHRIGDASAACFRKLVADGNFHRMLEMTRLSVNEFGYITEKRLLYSYTKASCILVDHAKGEIGTLTTVPAKVDDLPRAE